MCAKLHNLIPIERKVIPCPLTNVNRNFRTTIRVGLRVHVLGHGPLFCSKRLHLSQLSVTEFVPIR